MMASKTFSGQLDQAMDELAAEGNKILFIPQQNVGEVLEGAASEMTVESDGTYSIKLAYNTYSIYHYSDVTKRKRLLADGIVVSSETSVTTIPGLIGSTVPVTEDSVLTIQGYLDEANEAKTDAETAQAATEALYEDFDSNVAGAMALVHTETPSLSAPFNESGRLDYGIGTEYVSGLPVYGVDFTRSTTSTVINKSGALETLAANEIGIGANGAWLHGAYSNYILSSSDLSDTSYWTQNANATVSNDGTTIAGEVAYLLETTYDGGDNRLTQAISYGSSLSDKYVDLSFNIKGTGLFNVLLGTHTGGTAKYPEFSINLDDGTFYLTNTLFVTLNIEDMGDYYRVHAVFLSDEANTVIRVDLARASSENNDVSAYVSMPQVVISDNNLPLLPYLPTTSSTAAAAATTCTIPVSGNFPATGQPFTFVFDAEFLDSTDTYIAFTVNSDVSGAAILFRKYNGIVQWFHDGADGTDANLTTSNESYAVGRHKYSLTFDGSSFAMYCDGALVSSRTPDDFCWFDVDGYLYFNSSYNNQLKNFKILPYSASADEVKSWGAPK